MLACNRLIRWFGLSILVAAVACGPELQPKWPLFVNTAPTVNGELDMEGRVEEVSLSPDGRIWLASTVGKIAVSEGVLEPWRHVGYTESWRVDLDAYMRRPNLQRVTFFTSDTAIATGFGVRIGEYSREAPYGLLRTTDGGETWDTVAYGTQEWIEAAFAAEDGRAWIGGGGEGNLMVSTDFGATWRVLPPPLESRISSIFMETPVSGFVGGLWNRLAVTEDGGQTWTAVETPYDQGITTDTTADRPRMLERVAVVGQRVVVQQGDEVFVSPRDSARWEPLPGNPVVFAFDRWENCLYAVDEQNRILVYDDELEPRALAQRTLRVEPRDVAARDGRVVVLDREGALYEPTESGLDYSFPLSDEPTRRLHEVRGHGDRLWGVTAHQIYTSHDLGETWDRVGFAPTTIRSFLVRSDGQLLIWDGHARNLLFDPDSGTLTLLESLAGYDVIDVLKMGDYWVAFGGKQYETTGRVEVGRTYFAGQFEGTQDHGFVLVSYDEGRSWTQVDTWEGGVANVFVDPGSGDMLLVSYLGGVRRLTRGENGYMAEDLILPSEQTWNRVPYVEDPSVVYFYNRYEGFIDGWIHHIGRRRYETYDGGRRWKEERRPRGHHAIDAVPTPAGYLVLRGGEVEGGAELVLLTGWTETPIWRSDEPEWEFGDPWRSGMTGFSLDDRGRIIAVLESRDVMVMQMPEPPELSDERRNPRRERR